MPTNTSVRAPATSFIVRVWAQDDDDQTKDMRGEVEHIGTGEKRLFLNAWSLLTLLEGWCRDLGAVS
jgi:hypothetical protein